MADSPGLSKAENQARIRKERREAKIKAGGSARLDKITGLGGGIKRDIPTPIESHGDPEEVDISEHFYEPAITRRSNAAPQNNAAPNDDQLRQMMLGFDPSNMPEPPPGFNPFAGLPGLEGMGGMGGAPGADNPMAQMMQQMMSGMGGMPGGGPGDMPTFPGMPSMNPPEAQSSVYIWRIIHAIFALSLGLYVVFTTPFTGSRIDRLSSATSSSALSPSMTHFFYIFATAEIILQTSRFFMEKGRVQQGALMSLLMGILPEPYKGYLQLATRYTGVLATVKTDIMVLVFVLGVCAWARST